MQHRVQAESRNGFHLKNWGTWGWLETIIKLIGCAVALLSFLQARINPVRDLGMVLSTHPHPLAVGLFAFLTLGYTGVIGFRLIQREIIAILFSVVNAAGHFAILDALLLAPTATSLPQLFAVCYVIGDYFKVRYLVATGHTEGGLSPRLIQRLPYASMACYALFAVLLGI